MYDWGAFTLFLYIAARMSGFVLLNPFFGRTGIPGMARAGMILVLTWTVYSVQGGSAAVPVTAVELILRILLELSVGLAVAYVLHFFFYIPEQAGEVIDTQMGMSMGKMYDPGSMSSSTNTAALLRALMTLIFFAANGHVSLLRIMLTSGEIIPYGGAALGAEIADRMVVLFADCALLGVKLCLPILGAELLGQVGMGTLMKVIPQINVFAINIELKIIVGLVMLLFLLTPMSDFLLETETLMLKEIQMALDLMH